MTDVPSDGQPITEGDVERFLAGEVLPNSSLWKRIMDDLEEHPEGHVANLFALVTEKALDHHHKLVDHVWRIAMAPHDRLARQRAQKLADEQRDLQQKLSRMLREGPQM